MIKDVSYIYTLNFTLFSRLLTMIYRKGTKTHLSPVIFTPTSESRRVNTDI